MTAIEKETIEQPDPDSPPHDPWDNWEEEPQPESPPRMAGLVRFLPDAIFVAMWGVGFASGYQWARLWP